MRVAGEGPSTSVGGLDKEAGANSNIAQEDVDEFLDGHTYVEMMIEGYDHHITISGSYYLLQNSEQGASALTMLCIAPDSEMLSTVTDAELSCRVV